MVRPFTSAPNAADEHRAISQHMKRQAGLLERVICHWLMAIDCDVAEFTNQAEWYEKLQWERRRAFVPFPSSDELTEISAGATSSWKTLLRQCGRHALYVLWKHWTVISGDPKHVTHLILSVLHGVELRGDAGWRGGREVRRCYIGRDGRRLDTRLLMLQCMEQPAAPINITIVGGGLTGLTAAMLLVHSAATSHDPRRRRPLRITIYDGRWIEENGIMRWRNELDANPNSRRRQVITLQDSVTELLDNGADSGLKMWWSEVVWPRNPETGEDSAERVFVHSRQARIMDVEDRLLAELAGSSFYREMIELKAENMTPEKFAAIRPTCNLLIGADSANGFSAKQRGPTGQLYFQPHVVEAQDADTALGIEIHLPSRRTKAEIVFLTLCQTIYLLNSVSIGQGFLNIRIGPELAEAVENFLRNHPACTTRTLADLETSRIREIKIVVELILAGLRMFGLDKEAVEGSYIQVFRLPLRSVVDPVYMCQRSDAEIRGRSEFPVVVMGDAALQHNFWPGRGGNSGLLLAWNLVTNVSRAFAQDGYRALDASHFTRYCGFLAEMRSREQRGRGDYIQRIATRSLYTNSCEVGATYRIGSLLQQLNSRCRTWRDGLGSRDAFKDLHPLAVTDAQISDALNDLVDTSSPIIGAVCDLLVQSGDWPTRSMNREPELNAKNNLSEISDRYNLDLRPAGFPKREFHWNDWTDNWDQLLRQSRDKSTMFIESRPTWLRDFLFEPSGQEERSVDGGAWVRRGSATTTGWKEFQQEYLQRIGEAYDKKFRNVYELDLGNPWPKRDER